MNYYFYKLIAPRASFSTDMTPPEMNIVRAHAAYLSELMKEGKVIAFGPVADPRASYGIAIIALEAGAEPGPLTQNDPAIKANVGFTFEMHAMPRAIVRQ